MKRTIYSSIAIACALLVSACGGGDDVDTDVTIYSQCGNTPNYANDPGVDSLGVYLRRWRHFPSKVYVDFSAAPQFTEGNNRDRYYKAVRDGVTGWATGTGFGVITFVDTSAEADISLRFGNIVAEGLSTSASVAGITHWSTSNGYITKGTFIVIDRGYASRLLGFPNVTVFDQNLQGVVLHEMGHALFISGHPNLPQQAMSTDGALQMVPSRLDINTIREAYCKAL